MSQRERRRFLIASGALVLAPLNSFAQPAQKVRRIGLLVPSSPPPPGVPNLFLEALKRAGYEEGKNLIIERRYAEGNVERLPALAEDLVRLDVELIVAAVNSASDAASRATRTIPIVMIASMFPVERGLVASLAHPGGNITGTVWWARPEATVIKMYQLAKEAMPNAKRSAEIADPKDPQDRFYDRAKQARELAAIGLTHTQIAMTRPEDLDSVRDQITANRIDVLYVTGGGGAILSRHRELAAFAIERKLVSFSDSPAYLSAGGLFTYGPDWVDVTNRVASYVDKILRGAKPRDLPIEQASKYVLALNRKTARAIGFNPPKSFMARVDREV